MGTIQMCSATFGNQMWSTRGAGLDRVMRAIEVRAGPTCSLVLQSKAEQKNFLADMFGQQKKVQQQRIEDAATKRETLGPRSRPSATRRPRAGSGSSRLL